MNKKQKQKFSNENSKSLFARTDIENDFKTTKYYSFIKSCQNKVYEQGTVLHEHHIIPQYWFDNSNIEQNICENKSNKITLSLEDHIKAHQLLHDIYGNKEDLGAVLMLSGQKSEAFKIGKKLGAEATHKILKETHKTMWDKEWQKEMAKRSMKNPNAIKIRSEGGKKGGYNRNIGVVINTNDRYEFSYYGMPVLCVFKCGTGGDVTREVNKYKQTSIQKLTAVLKGTRKTHQGWSCKKIN